MVPLWLLIATGNSAEADHEGGPHHSSKSVLAFRRRAGGLVVAAPLRIVERSLPFVAANSAATGTVPAGQVRAGAAAAQQFGRDLRGRLSAIPDSVRRSRADL